MAPKRKNSTRSAAPKAPNRRRRNQPTKTSPPPVPKPQRQSSRARKPTRKAQAAANRVETLRRIAGEDGSDNDVPADDAAAATTSRRVRFASNSGDP